MRANHHLLDGYYPNFDYQQPLKLNSTTNWDIEDISLTDIILETIQLFPCENPFKINRNTFISINPEECVLYASAMIHFLKTVHDKYPHLHRYIKEDILFLCNIHFEKLLEKPTPNSLKNTHKIAARP